MPVTVSGAVAFDVASVLVDAETADCDLTLKIDTSGSLAVHTAASAGHTWLIAGSHSSGTVDDDATLWIAAGTLDTDTITFQGCSDPNCDCGRAIGDFDANMTVQNTGGDNNWDTWVQGCVDWSIASGVTINMKDLELDGINGANLSVTGAGPSVSTLNTSTFDSNDKPMSLSAVKWTDV
jgi:hypothetical protein